MSYQSIRTRTRTLTLLGSIAVSGCLDPLVEDPGNHGSMGPRANDGVAPAVPTHAGPGIPGTFAPTSPVQPTSTATAPGTIAPTPPEPDASEATGPSLPSLPNDVDSSPEPLADAGEGTSSDESPSGDPASMSDAGVLSPRP